MLVVMANKTSAPYPRTPSKSIPSPRFRIFACDRNKPNEMWARAIEVDNITVVIAITPTHCRTLLGRIVGRDRVSMVLFKMITSTRIDSIAVIIPNPVAIHVRFEDSDESAGGGSYGFSIAIPYLGSDQFNPAATFGISFKSRRNRRSAFRNFSQHCGCLPA